MVVESLSVEISLATGSFWEANITSDTSEEGKSVRELSRLKKDNFFVVDLSYRCMCFL
jgi:hypothetical protein